MHPAMIAIFAVGMILTGATTLYFQHTRTLKLETLAIVLGIALVAGGLAILRDDIEGRRTFLWMLTGEQIQASLIG